MSLKYGLLGLLNHVPMTGYHLKKVFDQSVNNVWTASLSQIYRELGTLEKAGYLVSYIEEQGDRPDKKIYQISEEGRRAFLEWLSESSDIFVSPKRDEFMLKMLFAAHLEKGKIKGYLERFIENRKKAIWTIEEDQKMISQFVKDVFKDQKDIKEDEERYIRFIVKRARMTNELLIQWAEECLQELEE